MALLDLFKCIKMLDIWSDGCRIDESCYTYNHPYPQAAGGSQQMMQGGPRTQEVIWEGELQWKENVKAADGTAAPSGNKTVHTVRCQAKASKVSGRHSIALTHFWISATRGENKYFHLVSLLEIYFFSTKSH